MSFESGNTFQLNSIVIQPREMHIKLIITNNFCVCKVIL